jgi:hypothetical protein
MIDRMRQIFGGNDNMDDISRNVQQIADGVERIQSTGAIFDANGLQEYDRALVRIQRNLRLMHEDYRRLTEQAIRFQEAQDDLTKGGYSRPGSAGVGSGGSGGGRSSGPASKPNLAQRYVQMNQQQVEGWKTKALSMATAGGVLGFTISRVMRGLQVRINEEAARLGMEGGLGLEGDAGSAAFRGISRQGMRFGLSPAQSMPIMLQTGRATGYSHVGSAVSNLALSRGYNLPMGDLTGMQQAARTGGDRSLGEILNEALVNSLKNAGIKRELWEEFLKSSTQVLQGMSPGNTAIDAKQQMGLLALMSQRLGGVYARSPQRTGSLMSRMGQGMAIGGGDDPTEAFKLRAFGYGSGNSYVQARIQSEQGATAGNIQALLRQADLENPGMGRQGKALLLKNVLKSLTMRESYDLAGMKYGDLDSLSQQMAEKGIGVDINSLQRRVGRRTGDTQREIMRQQAMKGLAGSKGVQSALDTIAKIETSFIGMLTKVSNFIDTLSQRGKTRSEREAEAQRRVQRKREETVFDSDKPQGRNKKTPLGRFYGLVPDGA